VCILLSPFTAGEPKDWRPPRCRQLTFIEHAARPPGHSPRSTVHSTFDGVISLAAGCTLANSRDCPKSIRSILLLSLLYTACHTTYRVLLTTTVWSLLALFTTRIVNKHLPRRVLVLQSERVRSFLSTLSALTTGWHGMIGCYHIPLLDSNIVIFTSHSSLLTTHYSLLTTTY
jgi:hypothetical protein